MNLYWWRSNGESGQSGFYHATNASEVKEHVSVNMQEPDIHVVTIEYNVKQNRFTGEVYR